MIASNPVSLSTMLVLGRTDPATAAPSTAAIDRLAVWAQENGFEAVELSDRWLPPLQTEVWLNAAQRLAEAGLETRSVSTFRRLPVGPQAGPDDAAELRFSVELANALGAVACLAIAAPKGAWRPLARADRLALTEFVADLAERAADGGGRIAVELHDDGPFDSAAAIWELLDQLQDPAVGVNPDLANRLRQDPAWDWRTDLERLAPRMALWHVKNVHQGGPVDLDQGQIDYGLACAIVQQAGFSGPVVPETRFGDSPLDAAVRAAAVLRRHWRAQTLIGES
ncbi:MAG: sugar phosphate isomerase/epimerase [Propionibacteriaceae bacterium]|nr:sugar phosphate isomerase/epimerase [Propionibacteriaceae bacterium]